MVLKLTQHNQTCRNWVGSLSLNNFVGSNKKIYAFIQLCKFII